MNYDLSEFNLETYGDPICFKPNSDGTLTLYYGIDVTSISLQTDAIILSNSLYPLSSPSTPSEAIDSCIPISSLKHDTWVEFAFPCVSILLVILGLSMIYHIIIKRLLP